MDLTLWDKACLLAPMLSVNVIYLTCNGKEVCEITILEFERRLVESNMEETFQQ